MREARPLDRATRRTIEAEIERLIAVLDAADPDPDLEDNGDLEPSLGYYHGREPDLELDESEREPWLGSFDRMLDQRHWCGNGQFVNGVDVEVDHADEEPSLGAAAGDGDQRHWAQGDRRDLEEQHDRERESAI